MLFHPHPQVTLYLAMIRPATSGIEIKLVSLQMLGDSHRCIFCTEGQARSLPQHAMCRAVLTFFTMLGSSSLNLDSDTLGKRTKVASLLSFDTFAARCLQLTKALSLGGE